MEEPSSADGLRPGRPEMSPGVVLVIAVGGAIGAVARYGMAVWLPHTAGSFPWSTVATNLAGCLALGVLMVLLTEVAGGQHRLVRPFLGVGVLGGFTTFSTVTVDIHQLLRAGATGTAMVYLVSTVVGGLLAVGVGIAVTRWATGTTPAQDVAA